MKYITLLLIPFLLSGCIFNPSKDCPEAQIIKVPVYQKPVINMPERPVLRDTLITSTDGELVRFVELNTFDLMNYTLKLETIINEIMK